jgi:hypothetical protein
MNATATLPMTTAAQASAAPACAGHRQQHGNALQLSIARQAVEPVVYARIAAAGFAHRHGLPAPTADDLVQIVDALVVNADRHAIWPGPDGTIEVRLIILGCSIIIEVTDPDPDHMPIWPNPATWTDAALAWLDDPGADPDIDPDAPMFHGRGLVDIAGRAETVTAYREGDTKTVRAVLAVHAGDAVRTVLADLAADRP